MATPERAAVNPPRQIPLELRHAPGLSRDELVVGAANRAAVALVDDWPAWPAPLVVLAGPPGSGKTHLATIWQGMSGATAVDAADLQRPGWQPPAEGPVLVDDADTLGRAGENGLFHLLNSAKAAGADVLLTAHRFPAAWGVRLPDLLSRLKAAATVELGEPDDDLLAAVVTKLFADRQVEIEPGTVQYLVRRMERSLATASMVVDQLDRRALAAKSRISRQLAAAVLSESDAGQGKLDL